MSTPSRLRLPDDDHVDVTIASAGARGLVRSPKVDIQLKCRLERPPEGATIAHPLDAKDYESLRHIDYATPRILVVVFVPRDIERWTCGSEDQLALLHCGYWQSLRGQPPRNNTASVTV